MTNNEIALQHLKVCKILLGDALEYANLATEQISENTANEMKLFYKRLQFPDDENYFVHAIDEIKKAQKHINKHYAILEQFNKKDFKKN